MKPEPPKIVTMGDPVVGNWLGIDFSSRGAPFGNIATRGPGQAKRKGQGQDAAWDGQFSTFWARVPK